MLYKMDSGLLLILILLTIHLTTEEMEGIPLNSHHLEEIMMLYGLSPSVLVIQMETDPPLYSRNQTLAIVIPLIIVLTTLLFLIFLLIILLLRRRRGIELSDEGGPTNLEREDLVDGEGGFEGVEARWLEEVDEGTRIGYQRGKGESTLRTLLLRAIPFLK